MPQFHLLSNEQDSSNLHTYTLINAHHIQSQEQKGREDDQMGTPWASPLGKGSTPDELTESAKWMMVWKQYTELVVRRTKTA